MQTWLSDMDGVLVHEQDPIPGAREFVDVLSASGLPFLGLTWTPRPSAASRPGSDHSGHDRLDGVRNMPDL